MNNHLIAVALLITAPVLSGGLLNGTTVDDFGNESQVQNPSPSYLVKQPVVLNTETKFEVTTEVETENIERGTEFVEDKDKILGYQEIIEEGTDGTRYLTFETTSWQGELIDRTLVNTKVEDPLPRKVLKGVKVQGGTLDTDLGSLNYSKQIDNVWTTSYDGNCAGCTGRTYTGKYVTHGICATDPTVIPLGTKFYVPGYGVCSAEDIGGAIKGNKVDLGFEDVRNGWWSARHTTLYVLE